MCFYAYGIIVTFYYGMMFLFRIDFVCNKSLV